MPYLLQAYNNTPHSSSGLAPFYVLFGRHARLPVDAALGMTPPQVRATTDDWVQHHQRQLVAAYKCVQGHSRRRQGWDQNRYNRRAKALPLVLGERVLCRNFRRRSRGKLGPYWTPELLVIVSQLNVDQPVYVVRPEGKDGPTRTLYRNNLRPCPGGWAMGEGGGPGRETHSARVGFWPVNFSYGSGRTGCPQNQMEVVEA